MNKEQATALIHAINATQWCVPPTLFLNIINSPACGTLVAVANGLIELQARPSGVAPGGG